jgi:hypothetical protein
MNSSSIGHGFACASTLRKSHGGNSTECHLAASAIGAPRRSRKITVYRASTIGAMGRSAAGTNRGPAGPNTALGSGYKCKKSG